MSDEMLQTGAVRLGVIGNGRVGSAIARLALHAGHQVQVSGSGTPDDVALVARFTLPGVGVADAAQIAAWADLVVIAIALKRFATLDPEIFDGRIVIDVMNYWAPLDGYVAGFSDPESTSEVVQERLGRARVVRTLNHIGYHELEADSRPPGDPERRAVALAGNDEAAVAAVAKFVDSIGFDPVVAGDLRSAAAFAPGTPIFDGWYDAGDMADELQLFANRTRQEDPAWS